MGGVPVAAARAASGFTAFSQMHRLNHRRGLRRCYRNRETHNNGTGRVMSHAIFVAAARAAFAQMHRLNHRRGLRRCYRNRETHNNGTGRVMGHAIFVAAARAAFSQMRCLNRRRGLRRCYRNRETHNNGTGRAMGHAIFVAAARAASAIHAMQGWISAPGRGACYRISSLKSGTAWPHRRPARPGPWSCTARGLWPLRPCRCPHPGRA